MHPAAYTFKRADACEKIALLGESRSCSVASQPYRRARDAHYKSNTESSNLLAKGACAAPAYLPFASLGRTLGDLASQRDDFSYFSQFVEIIRPRLHHPNSFRPVFRTMHVGAPNCVLLLMRQLTFNSICIPSTHFIELS